jgi:mono/diheme cytochrome c family protein
VWLEKLEHHDIAGREEDTMRFLLTGVFVALLVSLISIAQSNGPFKDKSAPTISGKHLYEDHCAICHGTDGKGGGPYAASLKIWPPDLTTLTANNHGKYPELHVSEVIDGEFEKPAHGNREMPIWGPVFRDVAHYLQSIQAK